MLRPLQDGPGLAPVQGGSLHEPAFWLELEQAGSARAGGQQAVGKGAGEGGREGDGGSGERASGLALTWPLEGFVEGLYLTDGETVGSLVPVPPWPWTALLCCARWWGSQGSPSL